MVRKTSILKITVFFVGVCLLSSCYLNQMKVRKLNNGITLVPKDSLYFVKNYNDKKNVGIPKFIDTNNVYIESYYLFGPNRIKYHRSDGWKSILKFYENGNVNEYFITNDENINNFNFNPEFSGLRGVLYRKESAWMIDIVGQITGVGTIGTIKYKVLDMSKDTIKLRWDRKNESTINVYIRKKVKNDSILNFKADW